MEGSSGTTGLHDCIDFVKHMQIMGPLQTELIVQNA
jgi:hypothetical protein